MRRKFELDNEVESVGKLKNKVEARNANDWEEEKYTKSKLKRYWLSRDGTGVRDMRGRHRAMRV